MKVFFTITSLIISVIFSASCYAQTIDVDSNRELMWKVKSNFDEFMFAEATGDSINIASDNALKALCEQISVTVKSETVVKTVEKTVGDDVEVKQVIDQAIQTFSNLKLNNYQTLIVGIPKGKNKYYTAFAFIGREQVNEIINDLAEKEKEAYEKRAEDIAYYYEHGTNSMKTLRVGEALKSFYWGYVLSKGMPFKLNVKNVGEVPAESHLNGRINSILNNVFVSVADVSEEKINSLQSVYRLKLNFVYKEGSKTDKITTLFFSVNDGYNWSKPVSVHDGVGFVEMSRMPNNITVRCIYKYDKSETPDMVWELVEGDNTFFATAERRCSTKTVQPVAESKSEKVVAKEIKSISLETADIERDHETMLDVMAQVEQAISNRKYDSVKQYFTTEGFRDFTALCKSGNAVIMDKPEYIFIDYKGLTICRSILMKFSYSNRKEFVEYVSFRFTPDNKIESIAYTMPSTDERAILGDARLNPNSRMALLTFMEDYQTAYALRDIDYLERVFSEDALIITGHKIHTKKREVAINETVYDTVSKAKYIEGLRSHFDRREYINLNFTETEFRQSANQKDVFSIQVRQEYNSNVYGDVGYLFLLVDLRGEDPVIHVRAWNEDHTDINDRFSMRDVEW